MATNAGLYKVQGPNGQYFAVHDPQTGRLWTERSEQGARSQAGEAGLTLDPLKSVTHAALMRLAGRDTTVIHSTLPSAPSHEPDPGVRPAEQRQRPIISRKPFASAAPVQPIVTKKAGLDTSPFATGQPVAPIAPPQKAEPDEAEVPTAGSAINREVLHETPAPAKTRGKNPFADRRPPRGS